MAVLLILVTVAGAGTVLALYLGARVWHVVTVAAGLGGLAILVGAFQGEWYTHAFSVPWWIIGAILGGIVLLEVLVISLVWYFAKRISGSGGGR